MNKNRVSRRFSRTVIAVAVFFLAAYGIYRGYYFNISMLDQLWVSSGAEYDNSESLAACMHREGEVLVYVTDKGSHRVDAYDAETGKLYKRYGREGNEAGQFRRPNGIIALEMPIEGPDEGSTGRANAIFVVERDNRRVQAFWADGFRPAGMFGMGELVNPYGCAVSYQHGNVYLYVTDAGKEVSNELVKVYRLTCEKDRIDGRLERTFGEGSGMGYVRVAESIAVDDRFDRVLLCDEAHEFRNVKVFTRDGQFTGVTFADDMFWNDPEGIALVDGADGGFVIVTDQQRHRTIWHLFSRKNYEHLGAFTGRKRIGKTDGICIYPHPLKTHKNGLFFAIHCDTEVHAFALDDIIRIARRHSEYQKHVAADPSLMDQAGLESHQAAGVFGTDSTVAPTVSSEGDEMLCSRENHPR